MYPIVELFRGIAAFMIMTGHYWRFLTNHPHCFFFTMTGVTLFFVISGFVFGKSINQKITLLPYFIRRFFRIYPLYLLSLIAYYFYASPDPLKNSILLKHVLFLHTTNTVKEAFFFNGPYWTLPVEVEFYAIVPLLSVFQKINKQIILYLLLIFIFIRFYLNINSTFPASLNTYAILCFHLPGLLFEFLVGVLCYQLYQHQKEKNEQIPNMLIMLLLGFIILGILVVVDIFNLRDSLFIVKILYTPICAIGYAFVLFACLVLATDINVVIMKICIFCGQVSYGTYLFHLLIPKFINSLGYSLSGVKAYFLCTFIVVSLSYFLYIIFENPMRMLGKMLSLKIEHKNQINSELYEHL